MFVGRFENVIGFTKEEAKRYIDSAKDVLANKKDHNLSNLEIVLLKTLEEKETKKRGDLYMCNCSHCNATEEEDLFWLDVGAYMEKYKVDKEIAIEKIREEIDRIKKKVGDRTVITVSFKSKRQSSRILVVKEYYENNEPIWAEILYQLD